MSDAPPARSDLQRILGSARRLGVEMDEAEALQCLGAIARIVEIPVEAGIPTEALIQQTDRLILEVIEALEDDGAAGIVKQLLRLRDGLTETGDAASQPVEAARAQIINLVNNFFHERLAAVPTIQDYIVHHQAEP